MIVISIFLVSMICFLLTMLYTKTKRPPFFPPGPPTVPFIGNLNLDLRKSIELFRDFRKKYGDIFSLILGKRTVIVVCGSDKIHEALVKHADVTSDRPDDFLFKDLFLSMVSAGVNLIPVQECPQKEKLWKEKAKKYNCSEKHNNTLRTYHCIRDNNENVVETCLKRMKIPNGKVGCPWINRGDDGSITFGTVQTVCDDILSCPNSNHTGYFSDELYKYESSETTVDI